MGADGAGKRGVAAHARDDGLDGLGLDERARPVMDGDEREALRHGADAREARLLPRGAALDEGDGDGRRDHVHDAARLTDAVVRADDDDVAHRGGRVKRRHGPVEHGQAAQLDVLLASRVAKAKTKASRGHDGAGVGRADVRGCRHRLLLLAPHAVQAVREDGGVLDAEVIEA